MKKLFILLLLSCTLISCTKEHDEDIVITQPPPIPIEQLIKNTTWQCLGKWFTDIKAPNNRTTLFFDSTFEYHDSLSIPERLDFFITSKYYQFKIDSGKITMQNIKHTLFLLKIDTIRQISTVYEQQVVLDPIKRDTIFIRNDSLYIGNTTWNWGIRIK